MEILNIFIIFNHDLFTDKWVGNGEPMAQIAEEISYIVNFSGAKAISEHAMRLTFFGFRSPLSMEDGHKVIPGIAKVIQTPSMGFNISNIQEVIPNYEGFARHEYSTFNVLLFSEKSGKKSGEDGVPASEKKGFLFGISKEKGLQILGVWPYNYFEEAKEDLKKTKEKIIELIKKPELFFEVLFLTMK
jgi:hypothetical protein